MAYMIKNNNKMINEITIIGEKVGKRKADRML